MIDWQLFAACVSMLCGGKADELATRLSMARIQAAKILAGEPCGTETFNQLLHQLKLKAEDFSA